MPPPTDTTSEPRRARAETQSSITEYYVRVSNTSFTAVRKRNRDAARRFERKERAPWIVCDQHQCCADPPLLVHTSFDSPQCIQVTDNEQKNENGKDYVAFKLESYLCVTSHAVLSRVSVMSQLSA